MTPFFVALTELAVIGNLCVGAFFSSDKAKEREAERRRRLDLVTRWLDDRCNEAFMAEISALIEQCEQVPFHWDLAYLASTGEDRGTKSWANAFVGNPPFLGGGKISSNYGNAYRDWLLEQHEGSNARADLSAHFFRRADHLLGECGGTYGFIATNTISQGDTREAGLHWLVEHGARIYNATTNLPWPGDAAVMVSVVHLAK